MTRAGRPERFELAPGLTISRIVTGLWQVADMERDGKVLDLDAAAAAMSEYAQAGFDTFDMADHYGSAEDIAGRFNERSGNTASVMLTKWCPPPGPMTAGIVRGAIERCLIRLKTSKIDLLQLHWWTFRHPAWLDALREFAALQAEGLISHVGVTNFDTDHLRVLVGEGIRIVSNQVSFSLIDRRAAGEMSAFCLQNGIRLLAYGTLAGGFLTGKWLGRPEPATSELGDWSTMKYKRFVDQIGGWDALQGVLGAASAIARKHEVSMGNVAGRWLLDHAAVAAIIVGARLGEREHRGDNLGVFSFALDDGDRDRLAAALARLAPIPGDCGREYRRPPYLTATGDLSHHLASVPEVFPVEPMPDRPQRSQINSGSIWEPIGGYSRAVRIDDRILVSGTTATHGAGEVVCRDDPAGQAIYILDKIEAAIAALGGSLEDVVRTRIYLCHADHWEAVARVHGRYLGHVRPANTLIEVSNLIGGYQVEIEAEAVVGIATKPSACK
jgi:aryl-alcohol dehydrogenase-like predicted oxidoreductase/enamine deaminase RidA (YjgF/YER057c/UK114 family)